MLSEHPLITLGSPFGIGYEIFLLTIKNSNAFKNHTPFCIGSGKIIKLFIELLEINFNYKIIYLNDLKVDLTNNFDFVLINIDKDINLIDNIVNINKISDHQDGLIALKTIEKAVDLVLENIFKSITTLPVSKENINIFDKSFKGHTEFFQKKWNEKNVFMTFISNKLNILLLSTHIPLREVPHYINEDIVKNGIKYALLLKKRMNLDKKICFLGLNPHAGENGLLGNEELKFKNYIDKFKSEIVGFIPADTAFTKNNIEKYSIFIAWYHDQGLIPFKMLSFDDGVNLSFGMKYIRTSVDHGTGIDLIGKKTANIESFINAYNLAYKLSIQNNN